MNMCKQLYLCVSLKFSKNKFHFTVERRKEPMLINSFRWHASYASDLIKGITNLENDVCVYSECFKSNEFAIANTDYYKWFSVHKIYKYAEIIWKQKQFIIWNKVFWNSNTIKITFIDALLMPNVCAAVNIFRI